jgi:glucose/arabinose dehydrogenase
VVAATATATVEAVISSSTSEAAEPTSPADPTATPTPLEPAVEPTPTQDPNQVLFAAIGDYGQAGGIEGAVSDLVRSWEPELIITTGDNNYPDGKIETIDKNIGQFYYDFIFPYTGEYGEGAAVNRFFPSLGNHDWNTPDLAPYLDYFELPGNERYYDFVWGPVHFFALSSDSREPDGVGLSSVQAAWLQERLAQSNSPWKIAYMHHPPYSSARHGSTDWMQWPFKDWGIDAVLSGHDHVYERLTVDGLVYFTNGLGGTPNRYTFPLPIDGSEFRYRGGHGAMRIFADLEQMRFEFITVDGEILDTYELVNSQSNSLPEAQFVQDFPDPGSFNWVLAGSGFDRPVVITHADDASDRLFVADQSGLIWIVRDGIRQDIPFLDLRSRVFDEGYEQGLLGLVFHPNFAENGHFFVKYTDGSGATKINRFQQSASAADQADPESEALILRIEHPFGNHNGGHLAFGLDGFLYIAVGDGGSAGDPENNGHNPNTLLGSILRLDIDSASPYAIPAGNPFASGGGAPEIFHYGLRNPWRFAFDINGELYIADVGQNMYEEIDFWPADGGGGAHFGWSYREGAHSFKSAPPAGLNVVDPIWEYSHGAGDCSVTGGEVYRGPLESWQGVYLYGDFCSGNIWGLLRDTAAGWQNQLLFETSFLISTFGHDQSGNLYVTDWRGSIYQLQAND